MHTLKVGSALFCLAVSFFVFSCAPSEFEDSTGVYDVIIRNGRIVDGTGNPWFRADVGIRGKRVAAIGDLEKAEKDL